MAESLSEAIGLSGETVSNTGIGGILKAGETSTATISFAGDFSQRDCSIFKYV